MEFFKHNGSFFALIFPLNPREDDSHFFAFGEIYSRGSWCKCHFALHGSYCVLGVAWCFCGRALQWTPRVSERRAAESESGRRRSQSAPRGQREMRMASARCLLLLLLVVAGGQAAKKRKISAWHLKVGQEQGYDSFKIYILNIFISISDAHFLSSLSRLLLILSPDFYLFLSIEFKLHSSNVKNKNQII